MIDIAAGSECVDEWLPDFIAWAENPAHTLAPDLLEQAKNRVRESYRAVTTYDDHKLSYDHALEQIDYACDDVCVILQSVAEWIVEDRRSRGSST
ncbi:MAG: hypothetical protein LCH43_11355 [Actinobacteria bacterium]|nr:hypothetical protein [Actinomycetota bacterium]